MYFNCILLREKLVYSKKVVSKKKNKTLVTQTMKINYAKPKIHFKTLISSKKKLRWWLINNIFNRHTEVLLNIIIEGIIEKK